MDNSIDMETFMTLSREVVKEAKTIFEIGSMDGKDSLFFKSCYPNANVYAFEGLKENYELYIKHLTEIIPINLVVCDYDGVINYYKKNINGIHGILDRGSEYGRTVISDVACKTLQTVCVELDISSVDIMKVDVEGATYQVLVGMGSLLDTVKIMHIETESSELFKGQVLHDEVCRFLKSRGFSMIKLSAAQITKDAKQHDSVWIKR